MLSTWIFSVFTLVAPPNSLVTGGEEARLLSAATGRTIGISKELGNEVLYIRRAARSPSDELSAVAFALHASVEPDGHGLIIRRTAADLDALRKSRAAVRLEWIQRARRELARYRMRAGTSGSLVERFVQQANAENQALKDFYAGKAQTPSKVFFPWHLLPAQSLLQGILDKIGPREIARIPSNQSEVYESKPSAFARALPDVSDLVDAYQTDVASLGPVKLPEALAKSIASSPGEAILTDARRREAVVDEVRLRIEARSESIWIKLELFDTAGKSIDFSDFLIRKTGRMINSRSILQDALRNPHSVSIQLPTSASEAANFYLSPRAPLPQWFLHPDKTEPLGVSVGPAVEAISKADPGQGTVVDVSDRWFSLAFESVTDGKLNLTAFKTDIDEWSSYEELSSSGYTIRRPIDPEDEEASRFDRRELARLVAEFQRDEFIAPEVMARAIHAHYPAHCALLSDWSSIAQRVSPHAGVAPGPVPFALINLYGGISDSDLARLRSGEILTAGQLGVADEALALLAEDQLPCEGRGDIPDRYRHPAELYKVADVSGTPISLEYSVQTLYRAWRTGSPEPSPVLWSTSNSFAGMFRVEATASPSGPAVNSPRSDAEDRWAGSYSFRFAERPDCHLVIHLPGNLVLRGMIPEGTKNETGVMTYADLPQDMKDMIWIHACNQAIADELAAERVGAYRPAGKG